MKMLLLTGPNTDPFGTPLSTLLPFERALFTLTLLFCLFNMTLTNLYPTKPKN